VLRRRSNKNRQNVGYLYYFNREFFQIEAGKMKLEESNVKLGSLMNEASEVISPLLNQKKLIKFESRLKGDLPDMFFGDKTKVKQILVNLLSNAVKFTAEGTIALSVKLSSHLKIKTAKKTSNTLAMNWLKSSTSDSNKYIQFSVKDTGAGVNAKDFKTIFSAFEQASNKRKDHIVTGTGLGLNICVLLVKLMEGGISIKR
jgi:signal transduction histidine kinase